MEQYIEITKEDAELFIELLKRDNNADIHEDLIAEIKEKVSAWYKS